MLTNGGGVGCLSQYPKYSSYNMLGSSAIVSCACMVGFFFIFIL